MSPTNALRTRRSRKWVAALAAAAALAISACSGSGSGSESVSCAREDSGIGHTHGMVLIDGIPHLATHVGLCAVESGDLVLVSEDGRHDLMSLSTDSEAALLASGHPDFSSGNFQVEGAPPLLGLVRSTDGGRTWEAQSLLGEADFHALTVDGSRILGADGMTGRLAVSTDGMEWEFRGEIDARDLAVWEEDPSVMVAATFEGTTRRSADDGLTWAPIEGVGLVGVEALADGSMLGVDSDGKILRSDDGFATSSVVASAPDVDPDVLLAESETRWWVAYPDGRVLRSEDGGLTWISVVGDGLN